MRKSLGNKNKANGLENGSKSDHYKFVWYKNKVFRFFSFGNHCIQHYFLRSLRKFVGKGYLSGSSLVTCRFDRSNVPSLKNEARGWLSASPSFRRSIICVTSCKKFLRIFVTFWNLCMKSCNQTCKYICMHNNAHIQSFKMMCICGNNYSM